MKREPGGKYILDERGEPVLCHDILRWGRWFETDKRRFVARDNLPGGRYVSTIFLGLDHNFFDDGPPVLWESMVFTKDGDSIDQRRYCSKEDALAGHAELRAQYGMIKAV